MMVPQPKFNRWCRRRDQLEHTHTHTLLVQWWWCWWQRSNAHQSVQFGMFARNIKRTHTHTQKPFTKTTITKSGSETRRVCGAVAVHTGVYMFGNGAIFQCAFVVSWWRKCAVQPMLLHGRQQPVFLLVAVAAAGHTNLCYVTGN